MKVSLRGKKGCGNLMELPEPTERAFLRFKGKRLFPLVRSQNQRGTEARRKGRAPNGTSQKLRRAGKGFQPWEAAPRGGLAPSTI